MRNNHWILTVGALLGLGGIIAGALLDHATATLVRQQHAADTALRYQQLHAIIIVVLGLTLTFFPLQPNDRKRLALSAILLISGTTIFCGSLYAFAFTGNAHAAYGAPAGGITLMTGWGILAWAALKHNPHD
jgi:uncharacterized membrane protein YgdD (TMEM256/DUF423 family)